MKIIFEDKSYVEVVRSLSPGKVMITIVAIDHANPLATIASSVEITDEQLNLLMKI